MGSMSTQKPFPNVSLGSQAEPQGPRRSSLVTHLVAHSQQFSLPWHLQAFAVSYSSEHRFALSRQRVRFRDALVSLIPPALSDGDPFPGSLLSFIATLASPGTFIWSRVIDTASSITDRQTLEINARIERWALDEVPLPGKLVHQIIQSLYRENRFCRGTLKVSEMLVGPSSLAVPALAVVTMTDEVAPLASVKPCFDAMPATGVRIIQYPGEVGVGLQHLGILVGCQARAHVWPEIISWIKTHN